MIYPKLLTSSVNSNNLALTVKGLLVAIIPAILVLFGLTDVNLGTQDLNEVVDVTANFVVAVSTAISALMVFIGVIRKVLVALGFVDKK